MSNLFSGINTALRSMLAQQQAMQVTEHNVANASTEGYHRQQAVIVPGSPYAPPGLNRPLYQGQIGTGAVVDQIRRYSMDFLDNRYRLEIAESSRWDAKREVLLQTEATLSETGSEGLVSRLDAFWDGWQELSVDPGNLAVRADLVERADELCRALNWRATQLRAIRTDQDLAVQDRVGEVNDLAMQVARLNVEISSVYSVGDQPNDLLDQRDLVLDRLSELTGAVSHVQDNGEVLVSIGGHALVVGTQTFALTVAQDPANNNLAAISWADGQSFTPVSGELTGLLEARDGEIVEQLAALDDVAAEVISSTNTLHASGYGLNNAHGLDFFIGSDALSISVNPLMKALENIATASQVDAPGDGSIAMQMAEIRSSFLMVSGTATIGDFYTQKTAILGLAVQTAETRAADRELVANALSDQRESVVGVSLDEEAANLIESQRIYEALARMMTTLDDMLDRVINGMGRVGR